MSIFEQYFWCTCSKVNSSNVREQRVKSEKEGMLSGYTDTNKLVNVKLEESYIGKIVNVKIIDAKTWSLDGEISK